MAFLLGGAFSVLAIQCSDSGGMPSIANSRRYAATELAGRTLSEDARLVLPTAIVLAGPYLLVADDASEAAIHMFHRDDGKAVASIGSRGRGRCEFLNAWSIASDPEDTSIVWVYDSSLRRLTQLRLANTGSVCGESIVQFGGVDVPTGPVWIDSDTIATFGLNTRGRLEFFDQHGAFVRSIGEITILDTNLSVRLWQHAYLSTTVVHPNRNMIAAVPRYSSDVEIFRTASPNEVVIGSGLERFKPNMDQTIAAGSRSFILAPDGRFGYVDAAATDTFIFALFSGRSYSSHGNTANYGRVVHVFGWNGEFLEILRLESDAMAIAIDESGDMLFVVRHEPRPAIDVYEINGIVRSLQDRQALLGGDLR